MDLPATLQRNLSAVVVEGLVEGLEEAVEDAVHRGVVAEVGAEEDAVGVLQEEGSGGVGLPAELADASRDVDVEVGVAVEHARHQRQVLRGTAHVGADEGRLGVPGHDSLEGRDDLVEGGKAMLAGLRAWRPEVPVGMRPQLLPALVVRVQRVEEGDRVSHVDDDHRPRLRTHRPEGVESRIVHRHDLAPRVTGAQAQRLPGLDADRPAPHRILEPPRLHLTEVGPLDPLLVGQLRHVGEARRVLPGIPGVVGAEGLALAAVQVDDGLHAGLIECRQQLCHGPPRPAVAEGLAEVVVRVDHAEAGLVDEVPGQAQPADRPVVGEAHINHVRFPRTQGGWAT